ncbi:MAG TPA: SDR family oxidoreductase [Rhodocyclaceae bacterium]|nr:SDR family oxidoreductase [Rhodocyclaceae bacterium]
MKILICGADGFLGRHFSAHLHAAGHQVVRAVRSPRTTGDIAIDYCRDLSVDAWLPRLEDVDVVINAIGILIETSAQPFAAIHTDAPKALFDACAAKGGIRVIQISALGVQSGTTQYFRSKLAADAHLATLDLDWAIVRPGLIYGLDGGSSRVLRLLASLPLISLPGNGSQALQPIHIDDLCRCIQALVEATAPLKRDYELAGPQKISYKDLLALYRRGMGLGKPVFLPIPMALMRLTARIAELLPQRVLSRDTLSMLAGGNTTSRKDAQVLLGRDLVAPENFITPITQSAVLSEAVSLWTQPLLRVALAIMWFAASGLSLLQPDVSLALLAQVGLSGVTATAALYGASALDLILGVLTLLRPSRCLWLTQIALVAGYTAIISIWLPAYWLHPFGPVVKNLPILALLLMLHASSTRKI